MNAREFRQRVAGLLEPKRKEAEEIQRKPAATGKHKSRPEGESSAKLIRRRVPEVDGPEVLTSISSERQAGYCDQRPESSIRK